MGRSRRKPRKSCEKCPRFQTGVYVPPVLNLKSKLGVVGEAPGQDEMEIGEPFVGTAGKILGLLLSKCGSGRTLVSLFNTVACGVKGNTTPTVEEIECCAPVLEDALKKVNPEVLILTGNIPLKRFYGEKKSITKWRGSITQSERRVTLGTKKVLGTEVYKSGKRKGERKEVKKEVVIHQESRTVVPTIHPAELAYTGFKNWPLVMADIKRAVNLVKGKELTEIGVEVTGDWVHTKELRKYIQNRGELAVDTETERETNKLKMISVARDASTAVLAHPSKEVGVVLGEHFRGRSLRQKPLFIAHNASFDLRALRQIGFDYRGEVFCTFHAAQFERSDIRVTKKSETGANWNELASLDNVCSRMPDLAYENWKEKFRSGVNYDEKVYCGKDACAAYFLAEELSKRLEKSGGLDHFQNTMMKLLYVLMDMEDEGVFVESKTLAILRARQGKLIGQLKETWERDCPSVNPASPKQLMGYFYDELGIPPVFTGRGKNKRRTLDRDAVELLAAKHPECKPLYTLNALRHATKMYASYLSPTLKDGRWHFDFNMSGTFTGRLSSDAQQFPRPSKDGSCPLNVEGCQCGRIRSIFTPDPGDLQIAVADYSQIELRLTALFAGEQWLMNSLDDPSFDYHQVMADHLTTALGTTVSRSKGKTVNHGMDYGMGVRALCKTLECDRKTAGTIIAAWKELRPATVAWWGRLEEGVKKHGYLTSKWGRRFYFRPSDSRGTYDMPKIAATLPQNAAQEVIFGAMIRAHKEGLKLRLQAHDELVVSCEYEDDPEILKELMEYEVEELDGWSCGADLGVGRSWEEGKLKS